MPISTPPATVPPRPEQGMDWLQGSSHLPGLVLGLGGILRLAMLGRQSLWLDEGTSYWLASGSWTTLLEYLPSRDPHPPLFYLILQPMIALGGSEWLIRLPSAVASLASIALLYALGEELFDRRTALISALILAISPIQIWFAQEARMYGLVAALSLAAGLFVARALRTNRSLDWVMVGLCEGLALLTDVAAVWFVFAVNVFWLLGVREHWRARTFYPWLAAQLLALLLFIPWLPSLLQQMSVGFADWIPPATPTILARTVADFIGGYELRSTPESFLSLAVIALPLAVSARCLVRDASTRTMTYRLLLCWFCLPIALAFLISQPYIRVPLVSAIVAPGHSVFLTRSLIVVGFPLYLVLARSLSLSRRRWRSLVVVALIGLSAVSYYQNVLLDSKEDYRTAAQIVRARETPNDIIIFVPQYVESPFAYYYDRARGEISLDSLTDGVIGDHALSKYASPADLLDSHQRAWLIANPGNVYRKDDSNIKGVLDTEGTLLDTWQLQGVSVSLYRITEVK